MEKSEIRSEIEATVNESVNNAAEVAKVIDLVSIVMTEVCSLLPVGHRVTCTNDGRHVALNAPDGLRLMYVQREKNGLFTLWSTWAQTKDGIVASRTPGGGFHDFASLYTAIKGVLKGRTFGLYVVLCRKRGV